MPEGPKVVTLDINEVDVIRIVNNSTGQNVQAMMIHVLKHAGIPATMVVSVREGANYRGAAVNVTYKDGMTRPALNKVPF